MNRSIIRYILGWVMLITGLFMIVPILTALVYKEWSGLVIFVIVAAISIVLGRIITFYKPKSNVFSLREGCLTTSLSWILISIIGCLPFFISREIPSFTDALFETISGFTTTGASILNDVEALSHCMLMWRSFTHWLGGMGVLVFLLAVIQMTGGSNMNLMKAESPGPQVGKLVPKVMHTARILYLIYFGITVIMFVVLVIAGMPVFDSITTAFGTAGTGGFGIKGDSMAGYSATIQWIVTIFMILFGVNFNAYYLIIFKKFKQAFHIEEVWAYILIIVSAVTMISINIYDASRSIGDTVRDAAFAVGSVITTTGFATADFNLWPEFSRMLLVMIMFVGACAGSTGGGIKVSRFLIVAKSVIRELGSYVYPKRVRTLKMDGKTIDEEVVRGAHLYFVTFFMLYAISFFLIQLGGHDIVTSFTSVAATINNIGPGLNMVGPTGNFAFFNVFEKFVLMFDMLAGRLELFPMLMLLYVPSWSGLIGHRKRV